MLCELRRQKALEKLTADADECRETEALNNAKECRQTIELVVRALYLISVYLILGISAGSFQGG